MPHFKYYFFFKNHVERPEKFLRMEIFSFAQKTFLLFNTKKYDLKQIVVDAEFPRKRSILKGDTTFQRT